MDKILIPLQLKNDQGITPNFPELESNIVPGLCLVWSVWVAAYQGEWVLHSII